MPPYTGKSQTDRATTPDIDAIVANRACERLIDNGCTEGPVHAGVQCSSHRIKSVRNKQKGLLVHPGIQVN